MPCWERLALDIAERAFSAMVIVWAALWFCADLNTDTMVRAVLSVWVLVLCKGYLSSLVGDRCSAGLLPGHDHHGAP